MEPLIAVQTRTNTSLLGWTMHFLTRYGLPKPWTPEEVHVWIAKLKAELEQPWNLYQGVRRVWAQKPYDTEKEEAAA